MSEKEFIDLLGETRGAMVSSADCSEIEIAFARVCNRFFVNEQGFGFVIRPKKWRENAEADANKRTAWAKANTQDDYLSLCR